MCPADLRRVKTGKAPRTPHIHGESVTMAMRRLRISSDVEDISIHDMRRAVSNWLKDQGVSREVRDLVLNHKDPSVTEAHYSNAARMERQVKAALQSWADHVQSVAVGQKQATSPNSPIIASQLRARHTMIDMTIPMKTVAKVIAVARNARAGM